MQMTRRAILAASAATPALSLSTRAAMSASTLPASNAFPNMPISYFDASSIHPLPLGAKAARNQQLIDDEMPARRQEIIGALGRLLGASTDELMVTQSTTMGENLVHRALGIPEGGGRIVTDVLHFTGSFYTYSELGKAGMDVVTLPMTSDGRISMDAFDAALNKKTKLVAISAVSATNGFQHDIKKVCDSAHAHGALVYVDLIQGAGTVPIDLRAAGVDFAATSCYKYLMGDFGIGFLYVRKEIQDRIKRPWWGYFQVGKEVTTHVFPYDTPASHVADYTSSPNAEGYFAMGTTSWTGLAYLSYSLPWLLALGIENIQTWRQPMMKAIQSELRHRGYQVLTPEDSKTQIVAAAFKNADAKLTNRLKKAGVQLTILPNRIRISVSTYNTMNDIDRLLGALPAAPA
jgi:selenocysteine lyase/cysteine desulfurase